ncbi:outer membrane beta-barrel protein [Maribellus sediminis]|uniref:outer membrane beta-barrel protein n=1 Tax=Maribellus sediminis TaxID=2696285 RepID=UPI00143192BA|nr:outer membrane beta-barrel protein [Maribellus sediminis]
MKLSSPLKNNFYLNHLLFFWSLMLSISTSTFAQVSDTIVPVDEDTEKILSRIDIRNISTNGFNLWRDDFSGHWAGIDFGFNMFLNEDYSAYETDFMSNDVLRSNSVYINFVQQSISLQRYRNTFGLITGLGLRLQSYRLDDKTTIVLDNNNVVQPHEPNFENIKKSKLGIMSLVLPVLAEVQIPVNNYKNRIYISGGMYGGVKLTSHTKVKYKVEQNEKLKVVDHFSLRDFNYGLMFRTGYRWINLYASYDLVSFFKEDKGPELTPFSFGITLIRF